MATILNRWHRPHRGPGTDARRPDPVVDAPGRSAPEPTRAVAVTRAWVLLMAGLVLFAAVSAVVILAR